MSGQSAEKPNIPDGTRRRRAAIIAAIIAAMVILLGGLAALLMFGGSKNTQTARENEASEEEPAAAEPTPEPPEEYLTAHFIDVGQADCILLDCCGETMLIDGGNRDDGDDVLAYLQSEGIQRLNYVLCTHPHEDHAGGLAEIVGGIDVGTGLASISESENSYFTAFAEALAEKDVEMRVLTVGERLTLGSADILVLGPISDSENPNNLSLVLRVGFEGRVFIFTGDAELDEQLEIIDRWGESEDLDCDVLKVPHHGSNTSLEYANSDLGPTAEFPFLDYVRPEYAVISVGENNEYGHPNDYVLRLIRECGAEIYRTDESGTVRISVRGGELSIETEK